jgi:hypothetical protein
MHWSMYHTYLMEQPRGFLRREFGSKWIKNGYSLMRQALVCGPCDEDRRRMFNLLIAEEQWYALGRPYYHLYPKIVPFLCRTDLSRLTGDIAKESLYDALRIVATCCVLADDVLEPDLLARDRDSVATEAAIRRARARGLVGWTVGRGLEVPPHWRGGCLATYYYGPRPGVPKIRYRAGCVVHKNIVKEVPSGYLRTDA